MSARICGMNGEAIRLDGLGGGRVRMLIDHGIAAGTSSVILSREQAGSLAEGLNLTAGLGGYPAVGAAPSPENEIIPIMKNLNI